MRETGIAEQFMSASDFEELRQAGLELFEYLKQQNFQLRGDSQESPEHLGIPDLQVETRIVSDGITALAKRFRDPEAKKVSWEEYLDLKTRAQALLEKIKSLHS